MSYSPVRGRAALVNVIAVDVGDVPEFEDWYSFEHFPERLSVPGFLRGRRYVAASGPERGRLGFYSIYETVDTEVLTSPAYLAKLDAPSEWTRRSVALFRTNERSACRISWSDGAGTAGDILLGEVHPASERAEDLRGRLIALAGGLLADRRILSGYLLESDDEVTRAKDETAEGKVAAGGGSPAAAEQRWYLVLERHGVEGSALGSPRIAAAEVLAALAALPAGSTTAEPVVREYRLISSRETDSREAASDSAAPGPDSIAPPAPGSTTPDTTRLDPKE